MKKIIIYGLMAVLLLLPVEGTDVGKLLPVELIYISVDGKTVTIATDVGQMGSGETVAAAIANLKATAPGIIFLDTSDYVLMTETAKENIEDVKAVLKPSMRVCVLRTDTDLKEAARFLAIHQPGLKLADAKKDSNMDVLTGEGGRFVLKKD